MSYKIFIDGSSRGNPGLSGAGFLIIDAQRNWPLAAGAIPLGELTNNKAEYEALIHALGKMGELGLLNSDVEIYTDSQLIHGHLMLGWKIKDHMRPYVDRASSLLSFFRARIIQTKRKELEVVDFLANLGNDKNGTK